MPNESYIEFLKRIFQTTEVEEKYSRKLEFFEDDLPSYGDLANFIAEQYHPDKKFLEYAEWSEEYWVLREDSWYSKDKCGCGCCLTRDVCFFCGKVIGATYERGKNGWHNKLRIACYNCYEEGIEEAIRDGEISQRP